MYREPLAKAFSITSKVHWVEYSYLYRLEMVPLLNKYYQNEDILTGNEIPQNCSYTLFLS